MLEDAPLATVSSGCFYARKAQHFFDPPIFKGKKILITIFFLIYIFSFYLYWCNLALC